MRSSGTFINLAMKYQCLTVTLTLTLTLVAWENSQHLAMWPMVSPAKWHLRNERRNSIRITRHYPDLGSSSDWLNQISHAAWPIRCTTQTWVVMHHQYGNSCAHFSFRGETSSGNAKSQLFSQAIPWGTSFPFYPSRFCGSTLPMTWYPWSMTLYLWPMTYYP